MKSKVLEVGKEFKGEGKKKEKKEKEGEKEGEKGKKKEVRESKGRERKKQLVGPQPQYLNIPNSPLQ